MDFKELIDKINRNTAAQKEKKERWERELGLAPLKRLEREPTELEVLLQMWEQAGEAALSPEPEGVELPSRELEGVELLSQGPEEVRKLPPPQPRPPTLETSPVLLGSAHRYHPCTDSGGAKMNTRCPPKRVPSAARFFTLCRLTMQPPQSYSVGGQRSSGAAYRQARRCFSLYDREILNGTYIHSPGGGVGASTAQEGGVGASTAQEGGVGASTAQEGGVGASTATRGDQRWEAFLHTVEASCWCTICGGLGHSPLNCPLLPEGRLLLPVPSAEGKYLLVLPPPPWEDCMLLPPPPAEEEYLLVPLPWEDCVKLPSQPAEREYLLVPPPPLREDCVSLPAEEECLLVEFLI
ncbi:UNVERIFIED_CONTAM: hypothetical protein FKN15_008194 [Acipenser sinensis]